MSTTYAECSKCHSINKVSFNNDKMPICGKCGSELYLHGLVSQVSEQGLRKILKHSQVPVVVDFWASWCGPCKMYGPEFEKASLLNKNTVFLKVNTETEQQLSFQLGIRGIPCTILFKDAQEIRRQAGAMSAEQLTQFIS